MYQAVILEPENHLSCCYRVLQKRIAQETGASFALRWPPHITLASPYKSTQLPNLGDIAVRSIKMEFDSIEVKSGGTYGLGNEVLFHYKPSRDFISLASLYDQTKSPHISAVLKDLSREGLEVTRKLLSRCDLSCFRKTATFDRVTVLKSKDKSLWSPLLTLYLQ